MHDLSLYFRALADRKRFLIALELANHDHATVTELGGQLRMSQPLISWHLRMLRRAGIVKTRRVGREVHCSLNRRALEAYGREMDKTFGLSATHGSDEQTQPVSFPVKHVHAGYTD